MAFEAFPRATVVYNGLTLGGAAIAGVAIVAQFGVGAAIGYLLLLGASTVGVMAQVCAWCGYYGQRCALGMGLVVPLFFRKRDGPFLSTPLQILVTLLMAVALLLPIGGGIALLVRDFTVGRLVLWVALVALLAAGLIPHTRLACGHCQQGACGACPLGKRVRDRGQR